MAERRITYKDGHVFDILGKPWTLKLITSKDKKLIEFLEAWAKEREIAGLCFPNKEGGTIFVRLDLGNPKETLRHELCEGLLAEVQRNLHKPPQSFEKEDKKK